MAGESAGRVRDKLEAMTGAENSSRRLRRGYSGNGGRERADRQENARAGSPVDRFIVASRIGWRKLVSHLRL